MGGKEWGEKEHEGGTGLKNRKKEWEEWNRSKEWEDKNGRNETGGKE